MKSWLKEQNFLLVCLLLAFLTACSAVTTENVGPAANTPQANQTLPPALKTVKPTSSSLGQTTQQTLPTEVAQTAVPLAATVPPKPTNAPSTAATKTAPQAPPTTEPSPPAPEPPPAADPATAVPLTLPTVPAAPTSLPAANPTAALPSAPAASPEPLDAATAVPALPTLAPPAATAPTFATATTKPTAEPSATTIPTAGPDPTTASGTLAHFSNCASNTGGNATIALPADTPISGGPALAAGDEIAIVNPGETICAGSAVWSGQNIALTAWSDDSQTAAVDGLKALEVMRYLVWDASEGVEYTATEVTYSVGDGVFTVDSIHAISAMILERS